MDFNPYAKEDKQQKIRIIIATAAIAVIVLGIATWAIIAIVGSKDNIALNQDTTIAIDDGIANEKEPEDAPKTEGVIKETEPIIEKGQETEKSVSLPTPVVTQEASVPETGPEEVLPVALIAGLMIAYLGSRKLAEARI